MIECSAYTRRPMILGVLVLSVLATGCRARDAGEPPPGRQSAGATAGIAGDYESLAEGYEQMLREMPEAEVHRNRQMAAQMRHFADMMHGGGAMGEQMPMGTHRGMRGMHHLAMGTGGTAGLADWHLAMSELHRQWAAEQRAAGHAALAEHLEQMADRHQRLAEDLRGTAPEPEANVEAGDGGALYAANCSGCHGLEGRGVRGAFPPLAGSPWVLGSAEQTLRIVLLGLQGPLDVEGETYYGLMPSFAARLDDEELAALLTFVRSSWGNQASAVDPPQVATIRAAATGQEGLIATELQTPRRP